jgi:hypothetical protein
MGFGRERPAHWRRPAVVLVRKSVELWGERRSGELLKVGPRPLPVHSARCDDRVQSEKTTVKEINSGTGVRERMHDSPGPQS